MSEPPPKKQRRLPNPSPASSIPLSTNPHLKSSSSTSSTFKTTSKSSSTLASSASGAQKRSTTATNAASSPKKKQTKPIKKPSPPKNKGLYAFFGPDRARELEKEVDEKRRVSAGSVGDEGRDEVVDLIEDSDDEGLRTEARVMRVGQSSQGEREGFSRPAPAMSNQLKKASKAGSKARAITVRTDTRPWPIRFAPTDPTELAVNKTKVTEVRRWLQGVLRRELRQRILVLTGPAGSGKTATVEALGKELGYDVLEWRNPSSAIGAEYNPGEDEGAFSNGFAGLFEEFLGRAGRYASLELAVDGKKVVEATPATDEGNDSRQKVIVIEDFPNMLFSSSSAPLQSFRKALKSFLALPEPPPGTPPLSPLVLIITESATCSGPDAFTAWRLLSPEILAHPKVAEISFLKIAATFMSRTLTSILTREAAETNRKYGPSKALVDALSQTGDIRSALMSLEFLATRCDDDVFTERLLPSGKRASRKPVSKDLTAREKGIIETITNRESHYNIFHAVGKIVYNKRFGDDPEDPYKPPPPRPVLGYHRYHPRPIRPDLETLPDETGTDPSTFISALHENFLYSCNDLTDNTLNSEDLLDMSIDILSSFSDADVLSSALSPHLPYTPPSVADTTTAALRIDSLTFQLCTRQIMLSLPSPVKREFRAVPNQTKMYYPTLSRIWRKQEEVKESVDWYLRDSGLADPHHRASREAVLERIPFLAVIERARKWPNGRMRYGGWEGREEKEEGEKVLERVLKMVTGFFGVDVGRREEVETVEEEEERVRLEEGRVVAWRRGKARGEKELEEGVIHKTEGLVLTDDDIEDFD